MGRDAGRGTAWAQALLALRGTGAVALMAARDAQGALGGGFREKALCKLRRTRRRILRKGAVQAAAPHLRD